jgi:hypothetical protein
VHSVFDLFFKRNQKDINVKKYLKKFPKFLKSTTWKNLLLNPTRFFYLRLFVSAVDFVWAKLLYFNMILKVLLIQINTVGTPFIGQLGVPNTFLTQNSL